MIDNKTIEALWEDAKKELYSSNWIFEKAEFELLIDAMILKVHKQYNKSWATNKTPKYDEQLNRLEWMQHFLKKLSYKNCISHFQSKIIKEQEVRILRLEQDKKDLIEENLTLKESI